jgi:hypothetical protein
MAPTKHEPAPSRLRQAEADDGEEDRGAHVHHGQRLDAADAVGHVAADRPHQRAGEDAGGGEEAGGLGVEAVLGVEVDGQRRGQADEAAEGHRVEEHEPPGVLVLEHFQVFGSDFGGGHSGASLASTSRR